MSGTLVVEVFVGDDVEGDAFGFEPGEQMRVGGIVPQARAVRVVEGEEARTHREDGAPARRDADAAVVGVAVVGGAAVDRIVVGVVGRGAPGRGPRLVGGVGVAARVIGIGLIGKGRGQESDRCERAIAVRQHVEGQPILPRLAGEMERVGAALQLVRDGPGEIGIPAAIVEIAIVELDGGVVLRGVAPAHFSTGPAGANHGACRKVDELAVAGLRAGIGDDLRRNADREIPGRDEPGAELAWSGERVRPSLDAAREDRRVLELAGEMPMRRLGALGGEQHRAA